MEITLYAANDTEFTVDVDYTVSGSYRPGKTCGDPDSCYEAEYPEVEYDNEAVLTLKNGQKIAYDLSKLSKRLLDKIQKACEDGASSHSEPDYEPDDDYYDENPNVDCGTDRYGRSLD
jgi:hypothetical protein